MVKNIKKILKEETEEDKKALLNEMNNIANKTEPKVVKEKPKIDNAQLEFCFDFAEKCASKYGLEVTKHSHQRSQGIIQIPELVKDGKRICFIIPHFKKQIKFNCYLFDGSKTLRLKPCNDDEVAEVFTQIGVVAERTEAHIKSDKPESTITAKKKIRKLDSILHQLKKIKDCSNGLKIKLPHEISPNNELLLKACEEAKCTIDFANRQIVRF